MRGLRFDHSLPPPPSVKVRPPIPVFPELGSLLKPIIPRYSGIVIVIDETAYELDHLSLVSFPGELMCVPCEVDVELAIGQLTPS